MKKIFLSFLTGLLLLVFYAQNVLALASSLTLNVASPAAEKSNYLLPYPGILPDHPLYQLKMLRDKIMNFLIKDPINKVDFFILMADKRLGAGKALIDGAKLTLGETTIAKGEDYFARAVETAVLAKKEGKNVQGVLEKLNQSGQKHLEILEELVVKAPDSVKGGLAQTLSRMQREKEKVSELKKVN